MQLREALNEGHALLTLSGSLLCEPDAFTLRQRVYRLVDQQILHVIIDLGEVTYINSCGLGLLISLLTTIRRAGGDLRIARVGLNVKNLFVVTQLSTIFHTYESVEAAMASFAATPSKR